MAPAVARGAWHSPWHRSSLGVVVPTAAGPPGVAALVAAGHRNRVRAHHPPAPDGGGAVVVEVEDGWIVGLWLVGVKMLGEDKLVMMLG